MSYTKYASERLFGGQVATVGRIVVISRACVMPIGETTIRAGIIDAILADDTIGVRIVGQPSTWDGYNPMAADLSFVETKSIADVEAMPAGSWTWPVSPPHVEPSVASTVIRPHTYG